METKILKHIGGSVKYVKDAIKRMSIEGHWKNVQESGVIFHPKSGGGITYWPQTGNIRFQGSDAEYLEQSFNRIWEEISDRFEVTENSGMVGAVTPD